MDPLTEYTERVLVVGFEQVSAPTLESIFNYEHGLCVCAVGDDSAFVWVPDYLHDPHEGYMAPVEDGGLPPELFALMAFARPKGFTHIRFDRDMPTLPELYGLPTFDHK